MHALEKKNMHALEKDEDPYIIMYVYQRKEENS
jgi:hypothetical protein